MQFDRIRSLSLSSTKPRERAIDAGLRTSEVTRAHGIGPVSRVRRADQHVRQVVPELRRPGRADAMVARSARAGDHGVLGAWRDPVEHAGGPRRERQARGDQAVLEDVRATVSRPCHAALRGGRVRAHGRRLQEAVRARAVAVLCPRGAAAARRLHTPEVAGAIPAGATGVSCIPRDVPGAGRVFSAGRR